VRRFIQLEGSLAETSFRALVVDDHESWRGFASKVLQRVPELQVVGEASDGLQAIRLAQQLQPDLIVLDIGLPHLNGIEVARRICFLSPKSKVVFMSGNLSREIAIEALRIGGCGYVVKRAAAREFLPAVEAALQGKRFISAGVDGFDLPDSSNYVESVTSLSAQNLQHHEVAFYFDDQQFVAGVTRFLGTALRGGNPAIVVASQSHHNQLLPALQAYGLHLGVVIEQGRYVPVDVVDALSNFMVNDMPNPGRFVSTFGDLIRQASESVERGRRVAIFGEGVQILWEQGKRAAAIQIEKLCNQIGEEYNVDILCGYSCYNGEGAVHSDVILQQICAEHSAVYPW
jgi:DNA-binding NarL/FixJ family response regulator